MAASYPARYYVHSIIYDFRLSIVVFYLIIMLRSRVASTHTQANKVENRIVHAVTRRDKRAQFKVDIMNYFYLDKWFVSSPLALLTLDSIRRNDRQGIATSNLCALIFRFDRFHLCTYRIWIAGHTRTHVTAAIQFIFVSFVVQCTFYLLLRRFNQNGIPCDQWAVSYDHIPFTDNSFQNETENEGRKTHLQFAQRKRWLLTVVGCAMHDPSGWCEQAGKWTSSARIKWRKEIRR